MGANVMILKIRWNFFQNAATYVHNYAGKVNVGF
jgi:hypothetical protein